LARGQTVLASPGGAGRRHYRGPDWRFTEKELVHTLDNHL
jgi:hypothetical protein